MKRLTIRAAAAGAVIALAAGALAACGSNSEAGGGGESSTTSVNDTTETSGGETTQDEPTTGDEQPATSQGGAIDLSQDTKKNISIPIAAGWDEDIAVSNLWKYVLEKKGYTVDLPTLDIAPVFKGVASGDYDIFFDTWLPNTHKNYWAKFGDQVDDIGVWYDSAPLTIAVPDYMDIDSMDQLKSIGDKVGKTIIGIDPGAGLTDVTKNSMMPAYGLDDWTLKTSSTSAMLAALKKATDAKEPIVVTLWRPHWAYGAYPIKDLKDPKNAMGDPDSIHVIGSKEFTKADPGLTAALKNFHIDPDTLTDLETVVLRQYGDGKYQEGIEAWAKDNQDFMDTLLG